MVDKTNIPPIIINMNQSKTNWMNISGSQMLSTCHGQLVKLPKPLIQ